MVLMAVINKGCKKVKFFMRPCCKDYKFHKWEFKGVSKGYKHIYTIHECERCGRVEARLMTEEKIGDLCKGCI